MRKILDTLIFIFNPIWHIMLGKYDEKWDKEFNKLLSNYRFTEIGNHTANLNGKIIWIANYPYGCFESNINNDNFGGQSRLRPSRFTIIKAMRQLKKDKLYNSLIQNNEIVKISNDILDNLKEYTYEFTDNGFRFIPDLGVRNTHKFLLRLNERDRINYKIDPHIVMDDYFTMVDRLKDKYNILSHKVEFRDNEIDIIISFTGN